VMPKIFRAKASRTKAGDTVNAAATAKAVLALQYALLFLGSVRLFGIRYFMVEHLLLPRPVYRPLTCQSNHKWCKRGTPKRDASSPNEKAPDIAGAPDAILSRVSGNVRYNAGRTGRDSSSSLARKRGRPGNR